MSYIGEKKISGGYIGPDKLKSIYIGTSKVFTAEAPGPVYYTLTVRYVDYSDQEADLHEPDYYQVEAGIPYMVRAITIGGYNLKGSSSKRVTMNQDTTVKFTYI